MDKKTLVEMGLTEEQADAVMKGLDGEYVPKTRFNEVNEAKQGLDKQLKERDKQLSDLQKTPPADADAYRTQIAELQKANADALKAHESALAQAKLDSAIEVALLGAKAKNTKAAKALLDQTKIKMDGDNLTGLDDQLEALRKDADYLFEPAQQAQQVKGFVPTGTPAAGAGQGASGAVETQVSSIFGLQGGTV